MNPSARVPDDHAAALAWLVERLGVGRATLRLEQEDGTYPVCHEALQPGVASIVVPPPGLDMTRQPVVHRLLAGEDQVVQDDCASATDDPEFQRMLGLFGGLAAQIVTAIRRPDRSLAGMISVHDLRGPRAWTEGEKDDCRAACDSVLSRLG